MLSKPFFDPLKSCRRNKFKVGEFPYEKNPPFPKLIQKFLNDLKGSGHPLANMASLFDHNTYARNAVHEIFARAHSKNIPYLISEMEKGHMPLPSHLWPAFLNDKCARQIRPEVWDWIFTFALRYGDDIIRGGQGKLIDTDYRHVMAAQLAISQHYTEADLELHGSNFVLKFIRPWIYSPVEKPHRIAIEYVPLQPTTVAVPVLQDEITKLKKVLQEVDTDRVKFQVQAKSWEANHDEVQKDKKKLIDTNKTLTDVNSRLQQDLDKLHTQIEGLKFQLDHDKNRINQYKRTIWFHEGVIHRGGECPIYHKKLKCPRENECPFWHTEFQSADPSEVSHDVRGRGYPKKISSGSKRPRSGSSPVPGDLDLSPTTFVNLIVNNYPPRAVPKSK